MYVLTRVFCVLLYARVRLSGWSAFETHRWSGSFAWRSSHLSSFQYLMIPVMYSDLYLLLFCCKLWCILYIHIVASWTTILLFPLHIVYCSVSVFLWFFYLLYMLSFSKYKLTIRYFEQFKSDICGCEWLKVSGRYIWYQSWRLSENLGSGGDYSLEI